MKYRFLLIGLVVIFGIFQLIGTKWDHMASPLSQSNNNQNQHPNYWHKLANKSQKIFNKYFSSTAISTTVSSVKTSKYSSTLSTKKHDVFAAKKIAASEMIVDPNPASQNSSYNEFPANSKADDYSTYIYISEAISNDIMRCKLLTNAVIDCKVVLNNLLGPQNIVILNNNFYVVNYNQPILSSCGLLSDGTIESCANTQLPMTKAAYMIYDNYSLYITDMSLTNTVQCNLDYNLLIQSCIPIPPLVPPNLVGTPYQIFNVASYLGYKYFTPYNSQLDRLELKKCVESACSILHDPNLSQPNTIKILNNVAYLTDGITNNLVTCIIEANGNFAPCKVLKSGLQIPVAIAFYSPKV